MWWGVKAAYRLCGEDIVVRGGVVATPGTASFVRFVLALLPLNDSTQGPPQRR